MKNTLIAALILLAGISFGATTVNNLVRTNEVITADGSDWATLTNDVATAQATADAGLNYGAYVITATNATKYATFALAYAAANSGQVILVSSGYHDIGAATTFNIDKSVSVVGAGSLATTLHASKFDWKPTATNCVWKGLTLTQPTNVNADLLMSSCVSTNDMDIVLDDLRLYSRQNTYSSVHGMEISGNRITLNRVRSDISKGHAFVLKGARNVIVNDCESRGGSFDGFLIKSGNIATTGKGESSNIKVSNFISRGGANQSSAALQILAYDGNTISNVTVDGFVHVDPPKATIGLLLDVYDGSAPYTAGADAGTITNVVFNNCIVQGTTYGLRAGNTSAYTNAGINVYATLRNSIIEGSTDCILLIGGSAGRINLENVSGVFPASAVYPHKWHVFGTFLELAYKNCSFKTSDGEELNIGEMAYKSEVDTTRPLATSYTTTVSPSTGMGTNSFLQASGQIGSSTYLVVKSAYTIVTSNILTNDPIWIVGSSADGVYKVNSAGVCPSNDNPVVGALTGDFYVEVATTAAITNGTFRPGKVACILTENVTATTYENIIVESSCHGTFVTSGNTPLYSAQASEKSVFKYAVGPTWTNPVSVSDNSLYQFIRPYPHAFIYDGNVYVGVFAEGYTADSSNFQGRWRDMIVKINLFRVQLNANIVPCTGLR